MKEGFNVELKPKPEFGFFSHYILKRLAAAAQLNPLISSLSFSSAGWHVGEETSGKITGQ